MNESDLMTQARIMAHIADMYGYVAVLEGMKAENAFRDRNGQTVAYGEDAFSLVASDLHDVAKALRSE